MIFDTVEAETGVSRGDDETPREYLRRLGEHSSLDPEEVDALTRTLEREAFSAGDAAETTVRDAAEKLAESVDVATARAAVETGESSEPGDASASPRTREADSPPEGRNDGPPGDTSGASSGETDSDGPSGAGSTDGADDEEPFRPPEQSETESTQDSTSDPTGEEGSAGEGVVEPAVVDESAPEEPGDSERLTSLPFGERALDAVTDSTWQARHAPVFVLALLVTTPIPTHQQATREVATNFQALAILRDGLGSYGYLTVRELPASLHLYSTLTAPLVGVGYVEGGRLISLLAAIGTALLAAAIANRLWGRVAALLAPALFWANAYAYRYAWAAMPEMFDAFLSTVAVAAALRYAGDAGDGSTGAEIGPGDSQQVWLALALGALALATLNDAWAVAMAVPVGVVLTIGGDGDGNGNGNGNRDRRGAAMAAATALVAALAVGAVTALQPPVPREGLSVAATGPGIYLSGAWIGHWIDRLVGLPFYAINALHLFGGIAAAAWWLSRWGSGGGDERRRRTGVLLGTWTLAGLLPALAFPAGSLDGNAFYLVGAAVPVTLSAAWLGSRAHDGLAARRSAAAADRALRAAVAAVVVLALVNGAVVEGGLAGPVDSRLETAPFDVPEDEAGEAGSRLREMDVRAGGIVFVGNWYTGEAAAVGGVARVLVYANVLPRGAWELETASGGLDSPRFVDDASDAGDCEAMVVHGGAPAAPVEVRRC